MTVELHMSGKGHPIRHRGSAHTALLTIPELYGLNSLTLNGVKIPMICLTDLSLIVKGSSPVPKSAAKQQLEHWSIIDDIVLQEDINWYANSRGAPPIEWVWHDT